MCGIVGVASCKNLDAIDLKTFRQLLYMDTVRGMDSTGVAAIDHKGGVRVMKRAVPGPDFLDMKQVDKLIDHTGNRALIGHNRAATKGAVTNRMAHPFQSGSITGVHNGTLWTHRHLGGGNDFISDSEAIVHALSKGDVKSVAAELDGAFALVWHDSEDNSLNFLRNDERPLSIGISKKGGCIAWASEQMMLTWVAGRNKLGLEVIKPLPVGTHWKILLEELPDTLHEEKVELRDNSKWYEEEESNYYAKWGRNTYANNSYYANRVDVRMKVTECLPALGLKNKYDVYGITEKGDLTVIKDCNYTIEPGQIIKSKRDYAMKIDGVEHIRCYSSMISHLGKNADWNPEKKEDNPKAGDGDTDGSAAKPMDEIYAGEQCGVCHRELIWEELDDCDWDTEGNVYCPDCKVAAFPDYYDSKGNPIEPEEVDPDDDDDDGLIEEVHAYFNAEGVRDSHFTDSNGRVWEWDAEKGTWVLEGIVQQQLEYGI